MWFFFTNHACSPHVNGYIFFLPVERRTLSSVLESAYNFALYSGLQILGGYLSPVHDSYGKRGLISSKQRLEMCQLAVEDSSWLMIDSWECSRSQYSPTFLVMEHFRSQLDQLYGDRVQLAFVCGSDLYCTLFNQDIWPKEHVRVSWMLVIGVVEYYVVVE